MPAAQTPSTDSPRVQTEYEPLARLVAFYESLSPASLPLIKTIYAENAHFQDPFNRVQGLQSIEAIFADMFERTRAPHFIITGTVRQGDQAFVTWDFRFGTGQRELQVQGCSHLFFDGQGRVHTHRDYWDAAGELYEKLPVLGVLMRALRRRLAVDGQAG